MEQPNFDNLNQYEQNYSDDKLMDKLARFGRNAGAKVVYNALLLFYVLRSDKVPSGEKGLIIGALGYLILPIDLIPDFMPVVGFGDDLAALILVIGKVRQYITPAIREQAFAKLRQWFPSIDKKDIPKLME